MSTILNAGQGATFARVNGDGTTDVWSIPTNATVTIDPAKGFGSVSQTSTSADLATAESDINAQLAANGAV
jgi:hypothetical protein